MIPGRFSSENNSLPRPFVTCPRMIRLIFSVNAATSSGPCRGLGRRRASVPPGTPSRLVIGQVEARRFQPVAVGRHAKLKAGCAGPVRPGMNEDIPRHLPAFFFRASLSQIARICNACHGQAARDGPQLRPIGGPMSARKIIIDTDPGQDDAVAILLALASPGELDVLGVTCVAGNVPLALTAKNARIVCELAGKPQTRVFAGRDAPIMRKLVTAEHVHGKTGLDGPTLAAPTMPLQDQ